MRFLKTAALAAVLAAGTLGLASAPASATPISAGSSAAAAGVVDDGLLRQVQQGFTPRNRYRSRGYGHGRPYYGRPYYRPRVVCRIRYTPYGPRRVCFRR